MSIEHCSQCVGYSVLLSNRPFTHYFCMIRRRHHLYASADYAHLCSYNENQDTLDKLLGVDYYDAKRL